MASPRFYNINSSKAPGWSGQQYQQYLVDGSWVNDMLTQRTLLYIDVYFVNENTMDKISPPERSCGIPAGKLGEVGELLNGLFERRDREKERGVDREKEVEKEVNRVIEELNKKELCSTYASLGVFLAPTRSTNAILVNRKTINLPAIVMCPERIHDEAAKISRESNGRLSQDEAFRLLMRNVLAHEQAHALSWLESYRETYRNYSQVHVRILEETLAQLVALSNPPKGETEKYEHVMLALSKDQPIEYNIWKILAMPIDARICCVELRRPWLLIDPPIDPPEVLLYYYYYYYYRKFRKFRFFWEFEEFEEKLKDLAIVLMRDLAIVLMRLLKDNIRELGLKLLALRLLYVYAKYARYM